MVQIFLSEFLLNALSNLEKGHFEIVWQAAILTFWNDKDGFIESFDKSVLHENNFEVPLYTWQLGMTFIKNAFNEQTENFCIFSNPTKNDLSVTIDFPAFCKATTMSKAPFEQIDQTPPSTIEDRKEPDSIIQKSLNNHAFSLEIDENSPATDNSTIFENEENLPMTVGAECRLFLGFCPKSNRKIYWEFGHKELQNRHLVIFGGSGSGKTYAIQTILLELSKQKINSLVIDYTNSFVSNQLAKEFVDSVKPKQFFPLKKDEKEKIPLNPFKFQKINFGDGTYKEEDPANVANRVADIFKKIFTLGEQQFSYLVQAIERGLERNSEDFDFFQLDEELLNLDSSSTISNKIKPFIYNKPFNFELAKDSWKRIFSNNQNFCNIFQLIGLDKSISKIIIEFVLWDLYYHSQLEGKEEFPKIIVLDEMQNLDHSIASPLAKILTEGRKFGLGLILATQNFSNFDNEEKARIFNASQKLFFKPTETEVQNYAQIIRTITGDQNTNWAKNLLDLKKGECYAIGSCLKNNGNLSTEAVKIKITELERRIS